MAPEGPPTAPWTQKINDAIADLIGQQTHDRPFIGGRDLKNIWHNVLHHDGSTVHPLIQKYREKILGSDGFNLLVALTVLVEVGWSQWDIIDNVLTDNEGNCRHTLPLTQDQAKNFHWKFYQSQFTYLPKNIVQDVHLPVTANVVLPFTEPERILASGGSGLVTKVVIAPGFFHFPEGGTNPSVSASPNLRP